MALLRSIRAVAPALAATLAAAALGPAPAHAQAPFVEVSRVETPAPFPPGGLAIDDFDANGRIDLAVTNPTQGTFSIQRGDGFGGFGARTNYATGLGPRAIALADLNGDGRRDVVVANSADASVTVYVGLANAEFGARVDYPTGTTPSSIAFGDFNQDSWLDLAVANSGSNSVSIFLGTGSGSGAFGPKTDYATGSEPRTVAVADLDEDGRLDLVTANHAGASFSVLRGQADGGFAPKEDHAVFFLPRSLVVTDLTNDGHADVALGFENGDVAVHPGTGAGGFEPSLGNVATRGLLVTADWNGDGNVDFGVAGDTTATFQALEGDGAGGLVPFNPLVLAGDARSVAAADIDHNGGPDVVLATEAVNQVTVILNARPPLGPVSAVDRPSGPAAVRIARVNADAHPDLIVANYAADSVSVHAGDGAGGFAAPASFPVGNGPSDLAFTDVNADTQADLVVLNDEKTVSVLLGNGSGSFAPAADFPTVPGAFALVVGDVSGDGKPDALVSDWTGDGVALHPGAGDGTFGTGTILPTGALSQPTRIALARMDADTTLDLVTANYGSDTVGILAGDGAGGFAAPVLTPVGLGPICLAVGDVNGDGANDVVVGHAFTNMSGTVLLGDGLGGVSATIPFASGGTNLSDLGLRDVDRDGRLDLIVLQQSAPTIAVCRGDGTGRFGPAILFAGAQDHYGLALGDLDGNGRVDVVVGSADEDVRIRRGRAATRTVLTASPNPVAQGGTLTLTATVTVRPPDTGPPPSGGTVRFHDGTTFLGSAPVLGGTAILETTTTFPWFRTYRATYAGGDRWTGSLSPPLDLMTYVPTVDVPASSPRSVAFDLEGVRPNPAPRGPLLVHFSLASAAPARLELFDVRGRKVAGQEIGSRGPGTHAVSLATGRAIPAGVYFVRLTQGGDTRTARAVVLEKVK